METYTQRKIWILCIASHLIHYLLKKSPGNAKHPSFTVALPWSKIQTATRARATTLNADRLLLRVLFTLSSSEPIFRRWSSFRAIIKPKIEKLRLLQRALQGLILASQLFQLAPLVVVLFSSHLQLLTPDLAPVKQVVVKLLTLAFLRLQLKRDKNHDEISSRNWEGEAFLSVLTFNKSSPLPLPPSLPPPWPSARTLSIFTDVPPQNRKISHFTR